MVFLLRLRRAHRTPSCGRTCAPCISRRVRCGKETLDTSGPQATPSSGGKAKPGRTPRSMDRARSVREGAGRSRMGRRAITD